MRASRLLSILLLLRVREQLSAAELAATLEVSVRTVYRDVEALSAAGIPVYASRGPTGGYRLVDGFRSTLSALSSAEADALNFAGVPSAAAELGLGGLLSTAQVKMLEALPTSVRARADRVQQRFLLDAPGWTARPSQPEHLPSVAAAVWDGTGVTIRYQRPGRSEPVERVLLPLGLVLKAGTWYLVAAPVAGGRVTGEPRTYRVSRILALRAAETTAAPPAGFALPSFWREYQDDYVRRLYATQAVVRLAPAAWPLLFLLGRIPAHAAREKAEPADADGWVRTVVPIESDNHALHALLQLGAAVDVIEPVSLRRRLADTAAALAGLYAGDLPPGEGGDAVGDVSVDACAAPASGGSGSSGDGPDSARSAEPVPG